MSAHDDGGRTVIYSNGSKWAGEKPDPIERLLDRLEQHTLDPVFEGYGDFAHPNARGGWTFFGNFLDVSGVFNIDTSDPDIIARLRAAIAANKATDGYRVARAAIKRPAAAQEVPHDPA